MCQPTLAALLGDSEQERQMWAGFHGGVGQVAGAHQLAGVELLHQNVLNTFELAERHAGRWLYLAARAPKLCVVWGSTAHVLQGSKLNRSLNYPSKKILIITCSDKLRSKVHLVSPVNEVWSWRSCGMLMSFISLLKTTPVTLAHLPHKEYLLLFQAWELLLNYLIENHWTLQFLPSKRYTVKQENRELFFES